MIKSPLHTTKNAYRWVPGDGSSTWLVIGQTSAWGDESNPPAENPTQTAVNQSLCAVKASVLWVILDDVHGTIQFTGTDNVPHMYTQLTTYSQLISNRGTLVLVRAMVTGAQLYVANGNVVPIWRQLGVVTDLVPASGHTSDTFLPAANVSAWGDLETLENRTPMSLPNTGASWTLQTMIQYGVS